MGILAINQYVNTSIAIKSIRTRMAIELSEILQKFQRKYNNIINLKCFSRYIIPSVDYLLKQWYRPLSNRISLIKIKL